MGDIDVLVERHFRSAWDEHCAKGSKVSWVKGGANWFKGLWGLEHLVDPECDSEHQGPVEALRTGIALEIHTPRDTETSFRQEILNGDRVVACSPLVRTALTALFTLG